jgi:hypothetical protein
MAESAENNFGVTLLGTGAPPPVLDRFGPSTLVEVGDHKFIFDAGASRRNFLPDQTEAGSLHSPAVVRRRDGRGLDPRHETPIRRRVEGRRRFNADRNRARSGCDAVRDS